jgi:hypothetical protein
MVQNESDVSVGVGDFRGPEWEKETKDDQDAVVLNAVDFDNRKLAQKRSAVFSFPALSTFPL